MPGSKLFRLALLLVIVGNVAQFAAAQTSVQLEDLVVSGTVEPIATGFKFTEGPVWHPDGYLLFSDIAGNAIYKWTPDGRVSSFRSPSGHSNGLAFDRQGRLIACEAGNRSVSRTEADGKIVTLAGSYEGKRLGSPNDVIVKSDGSIYFTDQARALNSLPGIPAKQAIEFSGVYRISPDGKKLTLLVHSFSPNGLALSPDEKVMYINNDSGNRIFAFDVQQDGTLAKGRKLANGFGAPDGIKVDTAGNLYIATNSLCIRVYDKNGSRLGAIDIPEPTTNCAFGGPENRMLFVTAGSSVYRVQMKVPGVPAGGMSPGGLER